MAQVNAGRVRFVGRGEYNNSTQYYVFDLVNYNGNSYYAKVDTIGNLPTNTTYWQLVAEKGNVGPVGPTGNGISSIEKTSTSGLVDTYTITYTNGNTTTFNVSNGNGIDRIEKTATVGNKDTYTIYFTNGSTTTYEVSNGEVTREELEEEVDRLSMIYNAFPSTTGEEEEPSINGTAEVPFKEIGLKGNTSQESTTGKNKLPLPQNDTTTINGITYKVDREKGTITANGTATANANLVLLNPYNTNEEDYFVSGCPSGGGNSTYTIYTQSNNDNGNGVIVNTSNGYIGVRIYQGYTANNVVFYPMLEKGSSKTDFEPYTGGNPAPNPDYPYPVNVVTGDNDVKVEGKNLFSLKQWLDTMGATYTENSDGSITFTPISALYNTTYPIKETDRCMWSYKITNGTGRNFRFQYMYEDGTTTATTGSGSETSEISVATSSSMVGLHGKVIGIRANWTAAGTFTIRECMLEQLIDNVSPQPYEPYVSSSYQVNLGSMELCKIEDYQDYIYKENGIWYKYGAIGKTIITSDNTNIIDNYAESYGHKQVLISKSSLNASNGYYSTAGLVLMNKYHEIRTTSAVDSGTFATNFSNTNINIWNDNFTNLTTARNLMIGTIIYIPLATPTITEITDTTLIEQLDNLEKAYSYDTQTNISQTNQDKPFIISYEAILSLKNVLNS